MSLSSRPTRRPLAVLVAGGAMAATMLFGGAAAAFAQPTPTPSPTSAGPPPPGCTAADLARVQSGVSSATSGYLFSHPDVNNFFTGLKGQSRDAQRDNTQNYLNANPQIQTDLQGIRQPLVDLKARCQ